MQADRIRGKKADVRANLEHWWGLGVVREVYPSGYNLNL